MACYHPSHITVDRRLLGDETRRDSVKVPCGKCLGCRSDQARDWAIRLTHESQLHPRSSWFITLTYDEQHLPGQWPDDDRTRGTLDPDEVQLFLKRLRKKSQLRKFGYFLCGEYGGKTDRPHYHFASFGIPFLDKQQVGTRKGAPVYHSEMLTSTWGHGAAEITTLSYKSASYVAGYVMKKVQEKANPTNHLRVDPDSGQIFEVQPEFQRMSRRPALAKTWLEKHFTDVYPHDFVTLDGQPFRPPRFYDRWMEEHHPDIMEGVRHQRFIDQTEIGDEQLIIQEKVHRKRMNLFQRRNTI